MLRIAGTVRLTESAQSDGAEGGGQYVSLYVSPDDSGTAEPEGQSPPNGSAVPGSAVQPTGDASSDAHGVASDADIPPQREGASLVPISALPDVAIFVRQHVFGTDDVACHAFAERFWPRCASDAAAVASEQASSDASAATSWTAVRSSRPPAWHARPLASAGGTCFFQQSVLLCALAADLQPATSRLTRATPNVRATTSAAEHTIHV